MAICFVRLRRSIRPLAAAHVRARATSDMFDSPQPARTIVTCSKSRAATQSSPPDCRRPQNKEAVLGRLYFARQPDPMPTAEGPEHRPTMFCEARGRQPFICLPCAHGKEGWRHWVGLLSPTIWGAYFVPAQALLWLAPLPSPLPTEGRVIGRGSSYRTRVRYRVSRRVYDRSCVY